MKMTTISAVALALALGLPVSIPSAQAGTDVTCTAATVTPAGDGEVNVACASAADSDFFAGAEEMTGIELAKAMDELRSIAEREFHVFFDPEISYHAIGRWVTVFNTHEELSNALAKAHSNRVRLYVMAWPDKIAGDIDLEAGKIYFDYRVTPEKMLACLTDMAVNCQ
jgi:hypothetical protein